MKRPRYDYYSLGDAVAFGVRQSFTLDNSESWEVYVKLVNGNRVVAAHGGTQAQARFALTKLLNLIRKSKALIATVDGGYVDARKIVRIYLDTHGEQFATLVEDVTGEAHCVLVGDKLECREAVQDVARAIAEVNNQSELDSQPEDINPFESRGGAP